MTAVLRNWQARLGLIHIEQDVALDLSDRNGGGIALKATVFWFRQIFLFCNMKYFEVQRLKPAKNHELQR